LHFIHSIFPHWPAIRGVTFPKIPPRAPPEPIPALVKRSAQPSGSESVRCRPVFRTVECCPHKSEGQPEYLFNLRHSISAQDEPKRNTYAILLIYCCLSDLVRFLSDDLYPCPNTMAWQNAKSVKALWAEHLFLMLDQPH